MRLLFVIASVFHFLSHPLPEVRGYIEHGTTKACLLIIRIHDQQM